MIKKRHITIELLRVSSDSLFIEMIFECPSSFHMTSMQVAVDYLNSCTDKQLSTAYYMFTDDLFDENKSRYVIRIPVSCLGNHIPAMYTFTLKAHKNDELSELEEILLNEYSDDIEDTGTCSDINGVYDLLVHDIISNDRCPNNISDEVIRNYLILYSHVSSMQSKDIEMSKYFFRFIAKNFTNCCGKNKSCSDPEFNSCGCVTAKPSQCKSCKQ